MAASRRTGRAPRRRRSSTEPELPEFGRLCAYRIGGLFGHLNYNFELDPHEPTLLTGVNGTGKSTILRTIDAVSVGRWPTLATIPFGNMTLSFEKAEIGVTRTAASELTIQVDGVDPWQYSTDRWHVLQGLELPPLPSSSVVDLSADEDEWHSYHEYMILQNELRHRSMRLSQETDQPNWIDALRTRFPVLYVTDQRLVLDSPREPGRAKPERVSTRAVEEAARDVARQIQKAKSNYATEAQRLDRDFPQRVVVAMHQEPARSEAVHTKLARLAELRRSLEKTGLLAAEEASVPFDPLNLREPSVLAVVDTYVKDNLSKLETLEPLRRRLELFTELLNQHYRSKKIVIDQERGFRVVFGDSLAHGLPLASLSSGEQQILVLAYQILFRARPKTLVLIDEPELSLHVVWQSTFVEDLTRMGQVDELSFVLATHSPTLIGGREDLKRSLDR